MTLPFANGISASGIVATGTQNFGGINKFIDTTINGGTSVTSGAVQIFGGSGVAEMFLLEVIYIFLQTKD